MRILNWLKNLFLKKTETETDWRDGLVPDKVDHRDILASQVMKAEILTRPLPENYTTPYLLRVINQGQTPTCVGASLATIKEEKERREQNPINFSGEWIYLEAKKIDQMPNVQGTSFRAGLQVLLKKGAMPIDR